MDATAYVSTIRKVLNDAPNLNYQGKFWYDYELRLALNISQQIFLKYAIGNKLYYLLTKLLVTTPVNGPIDTYFRNPNNPSLLYPLKAIVVDPNNEDIKKEARIFWADAMHYQDNGVASCFIFNDLLIYRDRIHLTGRSQDVKGQLFFLRKPNNIFIATDLTYTPTPNDLQNEYEIYVYEQFIIPYACVVLGMKEITNQRDFKIWKQYIVDVFGLPPMSAHFIQRYEFTGPNVKVGRPPKQDIGEENA